MTEVPGFFVPDAEGEEQALNIYGAIREFVAEQMDTQLSDRRVFELGYTHDRIHYTATVGDTQSLDDGPVIAILFDPARELYYVCTTNRGVVRGAPILVGVNLVHRSIDFPER